MYRSVKQTAALLAAAVLLTSLAVWGLGRNVPVDTVGEVSRLVDRDRHNLSHLPPRLSKSVYRGGDLLLELLHPIGIPSDVAGLDVVEKNHVRPDRLAGREFV